MKYSELHCRTNFSFLEGASHAGELVARAVELGYSALAVTDRGTLAGVVRAHMAAQDAGLKLIVGAELWPLDAPPLVLWATDRSSYGRLCRLITRGCRQAEKGRCEVTFADVAEHAAGLLAGVAFPLENEAAVQSNTNVAEVARLRGRQAPAPEGPDSGESSYQRGPDSGESSYQRGPDSGESSYQRGPDSGESSYQRGPDSGESSYQRSPDSGESSYQRGPDSGESSYQRGPDSGESSYQRGPDSGESSYQRGPDSGESSYQRGPDSGESSYQRSPSSGEPSDAVSADTASLFSGGHDLDRGLNRYRELFGDRCYLLAELHRGPDDNRRLDRYRELSRRSAIPLVAAGDVHYHVPARQPLQHVLTATRHGVTVAEAGDRLHPNAQRHLKPIETIVTAFSQVPEAVHRTLEIADRCRFCLDELRYEYPEELAPRGLTPSEHLKRLAWQGARWRYPSGVPERIGKILRHELELIEELHYEAYFLTVWDLVRFARGRDILCQGRGSAANSAVCYCLGVTAVDPERTDVLFERFVSRERDEAPDIDVDFEHERREEVLQYLYEKYGRERAGMTAEVICYRTRSAVRDVGKALGLSLDRVDTLAKNVEGYHHEAHLDRRCRDAGIDPDSDLGRRLIHLVDELVGFPRHLSQHVGGMVMTQGPLCELVPIENAAMEDRTVIQWDKDDLDELGILKVDCLSLGMLTAIRKCFDLIETSVGDRLTLARIPEGDQAVYDRICRADTMGVFQIESRAQMSMLPRLKPRCYYDLVIEVAIVRPGPIQGNMVHPYLRRRNGEEQVQYPNEAIRGVLHKTMGVPIFQEQAMRLAVVAAGFTPGEADQLRRAMGAWRRPGVIDQFRKKLVDGMLARGLSTEFAEQVFHQIRGFGEYGFPESHAASFALLVYASAWLKHYYPAAFAAALINSQPMGFYAPAQLIRDACAHDVEVRPADVNSSQWDCVLEMPRGEDKTPKGETEMGNGETGRRKGGTSACSASRDVHPALRLGFRMIRGLSRAQADAILAARGAGPFRSIEDFTRRTQLGQAVLARLARADALKCLGRDRRNVLWETLAQEKKARATPLFDGLAAIDEPPVALPPMQPEQEVFADYQSTGLSLKQHPISFYREQLDQLRVTPAERLPELRHNAPVRVAGLVLMRQRPSTAKGITFVTLEDETGVINLVVHRQTWERYYQVARGSAGLLAYGKLESKYSVIHVVVRRLEDLSSQLKTLQTKSRDFR